MSVTILNPTYSNTYNKSGSKSRIKLEVEKINIIDKSILNRVVLIKKRQE